MPFQIRVNARVAPCVRVVMNKEQLTAFDKALKKVTPEDGLYLKQLKNGAHKPLKSSKTWPEEVENDIVEVYGNIEMFFECTKVLRFLLIHRRARRRRRGYSK